MSRTPRTPNARSSTPAPALRVVGLPGQPLYSDLVGATIDGTYRVDAHIAYGGLSDVFEVLYIPGACRQAMKVLRTDANDEDRRRFQHEYRTLLHLDHPGLVRVHHYGTTTDGQPFFTMELLRGRSLERVFEVGERVQPVRVVRIAIQVCSALTALHRHRVIHRDIKPGNIVMLEETDSDHVDRVKIIDLGIARLTTGYYEAAGNVLELTPTSRRLQTRPGIIVGTPGYIAPERAVQRADERQDVFAVGVTMYRLLTGKRAFPAGDPRYVSVRESLPQAPRELVELVERALAEEPGDRFDSMAAMQSALEDALEALTSSFSRDGVEPVTAANSMRWWLHSLAVFTLGVAATSSVFLVMGRTGPDDAEAASEIVLLDDPSELPRTRVVIPPRKMTDKTDQPTAVVDGSDPTSEPSSEPEVESKPTSEIAATRRSTTRQPGEGFRSAMSKAKPAIDQCLEGVSGDADAGVTVRVRVANGRAADITLVGSPYPPIVEGCLRDTISRLTFPRPLRGTFTHDFTP